MSMETFLYIDEPGGAVPGVPNRLAVTAGAQRHLLVVQANTPQEADAVVRDALTVLTGTPYNGLGGATNGFAHLSYSTVTVARDTSCVKRPGVLTYYLSKANIGVMLPNNKYVKHIYLDSGTNCVPGWYTWLEYASSSKIYISEVPVNNSWTSTTDAVLQIPGGAPYKRVNSSDPYDVVTGAGNLMHTFLSANKYSEYGRTSFPQNTPGIIFATKVSGPA